MPSPGFEPSPYGIAASVTNHYTEWAVRNFKPRSARYLCVTDLGCRFKVKSKIKSPELDVLGLKFGILSIEKLVIPFNFEEINYRNEKKYE
ncbi:hypothetical protein TNCV_469801 [Trichonephila clavipes]|nr:hypothetical protein TNCV_469801 [Trichonephila clavipes]